MSSTVRGHLLVVVSTEYLKVIKYAQQSFKCIKTNLTINRNYTNSYICMHARINILHSQGNTTVK